MVAVKFVTAANIIFYRTKDLKISGLSINLWKP